MWRPQRGRSLSLLLEAPTHLTRIATTPGQQHFGTNKLNRRISRQLFCEDQSLYLDGFKLWHASAGDVGT